MTEIDINTVLEFARNQAGHRHKISRHEMRDLLERLHREAGVDLTNNCMPSTYAHTPGDPVLRDQSPDAARVWANAVTGITVISVLADGCIPHGMVRFDQPGSMAPMQRAVLMFYPADQEHAEHDPVGYLRGKCMRLFLVESDPIPEPPPTAQPPRWRKYIDAYITEHGYDARLLDDGILEMRDPNDSARHQYTVDPHSGLLLRRTLPDHKDEWDDIGVPEWEAADTPPVDDLLYHYWEELAL